MAYLPRCINSVYVHSSRKDYIIVPKSRILPPNLNNNWMMAVIGRSRHVTGWTTLRLVGGRIQDLDQRGAHLSSFCFQCGTRSCRHGNIPQWMDNSEADKAWSDRITIFLIQWFPYVVGDWYRNGGADTCVLGWYVSWLM